MSNRKGPSDESAGLRAMVGPTSADPSKSSVTRVSPQCWGVGLQEPRPICVLPGSGWTDRQDPFRSEESARGRRIPDDRPRSGTRPAQHPSPPRAAEFESSELAWAAPSDRDVPHENEYDHDDCNQDYPSDHVRYLPYSSSPRINNRFGWRR